MKVLFSKLILVNFYNLLLFISFLYSTIIDITRISFMKIIIISNLRKPFSISLTQRVIGMNQRDTGLIQSVVGLSEIQLLWNVSRERTAFCVREFYKSNDSATIVRRKFSNLHDLHNIKLPVFLSSDNGCVSSKKQVQL